MIKAISVKANDDFSILVSLEDGRIVRMDMSFIQDKSGPVVEPLKNIEEFKRVFVNKGIVTWPTGYDIHPYFLIDQSTSATHAG